MIKFPQPIRKPILEHEKLEINKVMNCLKFE
jgi:hypothetical protein